MSFIGCGVGVVSDSRGVLGRVEKVFFSRIGGNKERLLLQRECAWIHRLSSTNPAFGMNEELDLAPFLGC